MKLFFIFLILIDGMHIENEFLLTPGISRKALFILCMKRSKSLYARVKKNKSFIKIELKDF